MTAKPVLRPIDAAIRQASNFNVIHQTNRTFAASAISKQSTALVDAIDAELEVERTQNPNREV